MKNLFKYLALVVLGNLFLTGCYTIVWDPTDDIAHTENFDEESEFYEPGYFGGYGGFYESPWWVSSPVFIITSSGSDSPTTKDRTNGRNDGNESFRNDGGRGNNDRNSGNTINTPPPTRDSGSNNTTNSGSYNSNSNSNSSSGTQTRNSGSNNTRNNSGTRNSGSGRR